MILVCFSCVKQAKGDQRSFCHSVEAVFAQVGTLPVPPGNCEEG